MDLSKRKEFYLANLRQFYKDAQGFDKETLKRLYNENSETASRLVLIIEDTMKGMEVAKKAFDELQQREQQRLEEKKLSQNYVETKLKVLEMLINKKKIPVELQKSLEG